MLLQYFNQLRIACEDSILTEAAVIDILVCLVIFFAPFALKAKPLPENEQRVRVILWWKFRTKGEWRGAIIFVILLASWCGIFSPYTVYEQDQNNITSYTNQIATLQQETNAAQFDLLVYKSCIERKRPIDAAAFLADEAGWRFWQNEYKVSVRLYELAFEKEGNYNFEKVLYYPYYYCALLKTNQEQNANHQPDQEAINRFRSNLAKMTNDFNTSVSEKLKDSYDSIPELKQNLDALNNIKGIVPNEEKVYVQTIIDAVSAMADPASPNHAKTNVIANVDR
jgi:hypothetical protein